MRQTITINDITVDVLDTYAIGIKYVSIVPVKLDLQFIKPKGEVYLVSSARLGNKIRKKGIPIGFIIKSRKLCSFYSPFNVNLCAETLNIINIIVERVNNWSVYYDFKNNKWPNYLIDDINKRAQKAKELEQSTNKLKDEIKDIKDKLSDISNTVNNTFEDGE